MSCTVTDRRTERRTGGLFGRAVRAFALIGLLVSAGCVPAGYESTQTSGYNTPDDVEYLAQYGTWTTVSPYGMVWSPSVVAGWEPFSYGHWIWSYDGWAWVSYEPFGWLVYHYGSWGFAPDLGWFWVPGDTWSPAPVEWYSFGDYTGWAPLPPPGMSWPDPWDTYQTNVWIIVPMDRFTDEDVGREVVKRPIRQIANRGEAVREAPDVKHIEAREGHAIPVVKVKRREINIAPQAQTYPDTRGAGGRETGSPFEAPPRAVPGRDETQPREVRRPEPMTPPEGRGQERQAGDTGREPNTNQPRKLEKMVLPRQETEKVKRHTWEAERQLLPPSREPAPRRDTQTRETPQRGKSAEQDTTKKKIVR